MPAGGGTTAVTLSGGWEQVVCANESVVQLYDLRKIEVPLETLAMPGIRCVATDDHHMLLGDMGGCLSLVQCEEGAFTLCSRLTVEHGAKKAVRQTLVEKRPPLGDVPQRVFSATALGTVQLWMGA